MDWLKLFALLVAVASVEVTGDGTKKKIRIHLPQKVKHIHHHKKIYITNHSAASQYAPAFMPSAEGAVAVPTNVAIPAVAKILPINSVEVFEEPLESLTGVSPAASKLLPLYRARGYYGPNPADWDDKEYDLSPPPDTIEHIYPTSSTVVTSSSKNPAKRVKIVKVNEVPRKKVIHKVKPKRIIIRNKPQPEEEHPVSTFHEQFYSDIDGTGTIRKIKKPQRIEKIIDGDTEHIHTYSEEHIHKVVFDDDPKLANVVGVDSVGSMSAISAAHPLIPIKNTQSLLAIPSNAYNSLTAVGSLGTPSHLEYAAYNPRDVTHDHIFHDHGEIPDGVDILRNPLSLPPKVSYNSQGLRLSGFSSNRNKNKPINKFPKATKQRPVTDFSYYESIYTPENKLKNILKPTLLNYYDASPDINIDEYRPIPSFKYKGSGKTRSKQIYGSIKPTDFQSQSGNLPTPYSLSSTVIHDYKPKTFTAPGSTPVVLSNFKDPFVDFKDGSANNFEYDTYASSSNLFTTEDKGEESPLYRLGKQKSISTQNINFGGLDHQTIVDHLDDSSSSFDSLPTAIGDYDIFEKTKQLESITSPPYTQHEHFQGHFYYPVITNKALHNDHLSSPKTLSDSYDYVAASIKPTTSPASIASTTPTPPQFYKIQSTDAILSEPVNFISESSGSKKRKLKPTTYISVDKYTDYNNSDQDKINHFERQYSNDHTDSKIETDAKAKLKYGDKI